MKGNMLYFVSVIGLGLDHTPRKLYSNWGRPPRIELGGLHQGQQLPLSQRA